MSNTIATHALPVCLQLPYPRQLVTPGAPAVCCLPTAVWGRGCRPLGDKCAGVSATW
jgi:hypothetical protein